MRKHGHGAAGGAAAATGARLYKRPAASHSKSDAELLLALKAALGADNKALATWRRGTDPCGHYKWLGVACAAGHVVGIDLSERELHGTLPAALVLPEALVRLNLNGNRLGGPLPHAWVMPRGLREAQLCCNAFIGRLPPAWELSGALEKMALDHNKLEGPIPKAWRLPHTLKALHLHGNGLSGLLPFWTHSNAHVLIKPGNPGLCGHTPKLPHYGTWRASHPYAAVQLPDCVAYDQYRATQHPAAHAHGHAHAAPHAHGHVKGHTQPHAHLKVTKRRKGGVTITLHMYAVLYAALGAALLVAVLQYGRRHGFGMRRRKGSRHSHSHGRAAPYGYDDDDLMPQRARDRRRQRKPLVT